MLTQGHQRYKGPAMPERTMALGGAVDCSVSGVSCISTTKGTIMSDQKIAQKTETANEESWGLPIPVRQGLYLVQVPLPHSPLKVLNSYIILGENETTVIDVGFNDPACEEALNRALQALGRSWDSVRIILTHSHPDHAGNLDRVYRDGMQVFAGLHSFAEAKTLQIMEDHVALPLVRRAATPKQLVALDAGKVRISADALPLTCTPHIQCLREGDYIEAGPYSFKVIETPGHSLWHICLYDEQQRLMIMGDHVLERITPAVLSWFPSYNALKRYHESLEKVRDYDVDLVLPGHGTPYSNPNARIDAIIAHDTERLQEIYDLVAAGHSDIIDISSHAKWRYANWDQWPIDQKFYSIGETMAHLIYLVSEGKVKQIICGNDYRFELP